MNGPKFEPEDGELQGLPLVCGIVLVITGDGQ